MRIYLLSTVLRRVVLRWHNRYCAPEPLQMTRNIRRRKTILRCGAYRKGFWCVWPEDRVAPIQKLTTSKDFSENVSSVSAVYCDIVGKDYFISRLAACVVTIGDLYGGEKHTPQRDRGIKTKLFECKKQMSCRCVSESFNVRLIGDNKKSLNLENFVFYCIFLFYLRERKGGEEIWFVWSRHSAPYYYLQSKKIGGKKANNKQKKTRNGP